MRGRSALASLSLAALLEGCATVSALPPDSVNAANYSRIEGGMTQAQVFAILGPGDQQSETNMNEMVLTTYVWKVRYNPYAQVIVTFKNGLEFTKLKVGL